jgi:c-di-AMP phosphodiesterase-like protein
VNAILSTVGYELISNLIAISQEDNIQIINNLKNLSIISLIGAICTGFLLFVRLVFVQPLKKHFIVHLDWVTMFYLVPIFEQYEQQIQERKQLKAFHQKFSQNFEGSLKSSLDDLQQQLIKYNDELTKQHNLPEMQNTFKEFTRDFDDFAMVLKQTKEFIDQLNNTDNYSKTNKLIADMNQHLHEQDVQFQSRFRIILFLLISIFFIMFFLLLV